MIVKDLNLSLNHIP